MTNPTESLRVVLEGGRTDGKRLSAHMRETANSPWLPSLPDTVEEFDLMHKSMLEHEAACVETLENALAAALARLEAAERRADTLASVLSFVPEAIRDAAWAALAGEDKE